MHVKGFTQAQRDVPAELARHLSRAVSPAIDRPPEASWASRAVELLPIHSFVDDRALVEQGPVNYWGYNTLSFFAPEPRYAPDEPLDSSARRWRACTTRASRYPRRRLQPHRRRQPASGRLCPSAASTMRLYRLTPETRAITMTSPAAETPSICPPARPADGDGFLRYWVEAARRRLPLRPGHHARARPERFDAALHSSSLSARIRSSPL